MNGYYPQSREPVAAHAGRSSARSVRAADVARAERALRGRERRRRGALVPPGPPGVRKRTRARVAGAFSIFHLGLVIEALKVPPTQLSHPINQCVVRTENE